jgi:hypothetical protein
MKITTQLISYLAVAMTMAIYSGSLQAQIKCWTNNEGVRECGTYVPPEFAQKGHEELSKHGTVAKKQERAKTEEELAEKKRQNELKAEEMRQLVVKQRHDKILLATFTNTEDIELARDSKISAIESSISLANKRNERMQDDMDKMVEKAAAAESSAKDLPEGLLKDIDSLQRQIKNNDEFITSKRAEQESVMQAYAKDIARFNELKSDGE